MEANQSGNGREKSLVLDRSGNESIRTAASPAARLPLNFVPTLHGHGEGLLDYWKTIRRRPRTVISIALLGLAIGVLVKYLQTPVYQVRSTLEIQDLDQEFLNMRHANPVSNDMSGYNNVSDIQTQIKIIESASLRKRVVAQLRDRYPGGLTGESVPIRRWLAHFSVGSARQRLSVDDLMKYSKLTVRPAGQTRIVEILFDSQDPRFGADFADTLANNYIDQNIESRWQMSQRTGDWLTRQLDDMRLKLERSENALQTYAQQTGLLFTDEKDNVSDQKLKQLQAELSAAQANRAEKQSKWEIARDAPPESLPDVINDAALREYQSKLTELRREKAEAEATYKPEYTKVTRIQAQIAPIEAALTAQRTDILHRIKDEYDEALRREKLLAADYDSQAGLVTKETGSTIQYNILKREVDSNRQIYDSVLQHMKEASVAAAMRASNVRVVDPASIPKSPYKPVLQSYALTGLLSGLFLGIAFVITQENADTTVRQPGDVLASVGLLELGAIPSASIRRNFAGYGKSQTKPSRPGEVPVIVDGPQDRRVELASWRNRTSHVAEAFRAASISIRFSAKWSESSQIFVVTSPGPSEGKSTVVSNLAIALGNVGQRVLIIDADLRRPRQHHVFGSEDTPGLTQLLQEREISHDSIPSFIRETGAPGVSLLPSGSDGNAIPDVLYRPDLASILTSLRKGFDVVLLDTPPMLDIPDARVLASVVDHVILTVRANRTPRSALAAANQRLSDDGASVLGVLINDWNPKYGPNGYYGYYGDYYGKRGAYYYSARGPASGSSISSDKQ
jgi:capsular exopolysaccharide synthesis family protein